MIHKCTYSASSLVGIKGTFMMSKISHQLERHLELGSYNDELLYIHFPLVSYKSLKIAVFFIIFSIILSL